MKVKIYSSRFVTKENPNGKKIIDIDTPEGVEIFGGVDAVKRYKDNMKISNEVWRFAEKSLKDKGEI
jgi:hypothetical protein